MENEKKSGVLSSLLVGIFSLLSLGGAYYYYYLQKKHLEEKTKLQKDLVDHLGLLIDSASKRSITKLDDLLKNADVDHNNSVKQLIEYIKTHQSGEERYADFGDNFDAQYIKLVEEIDNHKDDVISPVSVVWGRSNPWRFNSGLPRIYSACGIQDPETNQIERSIFINFCSYFKKVMNLTTEEVSTFESCVQNVSGLNADILLEISFEIEAAVLYYTASLIYFTESAKTSLNEYISIEYDPDEWVDFWNVIKEIYVKYSTSSLKDNLQLIVDLYYTYFWQKI